jgi:streptogramin lyase
VRRTLFLAAAFALAACGSSAGAKPKPQPRFTVPFGVASIGRTVYLSDWPTGRVLRLDPRTRRLSVFVRGLREPTDMVSAGGFLYLTEFRGGRVVRIDARGRTTTVARLELPAGIDVRGGFLYVSSLANYVYRVELATGVVETLAGDGTQADSGDGGPARTAQVESPHGIAADDEGNVYVPGRNGIRRIDAATGIIDTIARLDTFKLAPAPDGSLYFLAGDPTYGLIGRIGATGDVETLWRARHANITDVELRPDGTLLFGLSEPVASVRRLDPRTGRVTVVVRSATS